jgi:hypothetical protein
MIVSYLVSKLALSDAKDFISKNFVKLLIIHIILKVLPFAVLIIASSLYSSSMLDASKIPSLLGTIYFFILAVFLIFVPIIHYIYEKSIVYFIARKENDKYRTFLKWAILDTSIIKSIKSFIGYILMCIFYLISIYLIYIIIYIIIIIVATISLGISLLFHLEPIETLTIEILILGLIFLIIFGIIVIFIWFLNSYTSKSYFFTRVSNPSNWSSLKMAFSSISRKVIKRILKLILYVLIITIILFAILFVMGFVGLLNLNLILFVIIIYLLTEFVAYNVISDLYILDTIKTNSQSEMSQNAEQSK